MDSEFRLWPEILDMIYSNGGSVILESKINESGEWNALNSQLYHSFSHIETHEIDQAVLLLKRADLVEIEQEEGEGNPRHRFLKLTKRGFEVAHERELTEKQQETSENLTFFTLILAFAAIVQTVTAALQLNNPSNTMWILLIVLILTLSISFYQSNPMEWLQRTTRNLRKRF